MPEQSKNEIGALSESLSAPLAKVYQVGGLDLVFIFVGTLTMVGGNFLGGSHSTIIVIVGAVVTLACLGLFAFRQIGPNSGGQEIAGIRKFSDRVKGEWWELITRKEQNAVSFFRIEADALFNSVRLEGDSYDLTGEPIAHWCSVMARVIPQEKRILYLWEGWFKDAKIAHVRFHGFADMLFDGSADAHDPFGRGGGKFWNVNEENQETILKPFELRRADKEDVAYMTSENSNKAQKKSTVIKTVENW
jgi:hypothetical protein